jgi:hypothetical protein
MRINATMLLCLALCLVSFRDSGAYQCPYQLETTIEVTHARARAQTTRSTARCICCDPAGRVHMVWEDGRYGDFEVYYASILGDSLSPEVRITRTRGESSYPCVACDSQNVYVVWEEYLGKDSEIFCAHLRQGEEVARTRVTNTSLDSSCPVCAVGPDGAVHIAWHEGPYQKTGVYYAKVVADTVVETIGICTEHPEAFRPDLACDRRGRIMIVWYEGMVVKARYFDGSSWGEEQTVASVQSKPWRLSVCDLADGKWAASWFDKTADGERVWVGYYDGKQWYGQTELTEGRIGYYPNLAKLAEGRLAAVWEERRPASDQYALVLRCFDGQSWSQPLDIFLDQVMARYASLAAHRNLIHVVWFSGKDGRNEIYYQRLRSR